LPTAILNASASGIPDACKDSISSCKWFSSSAMCPSSNAECFRKPRLHSRMADFRLKAEGFPKFLPAGDSIVLQIHCEQRSIAAVPSPTQRRHWMSTGSISFSSHSQFQSNSRKLISPFQDGAGLDTACRLPIRASRP